MTASAPSRATGSDHRVTLCDVGDEVIVLVIALVLLRIDDRVAGRHAGPCPPEPAPISAWIPTPSPRPSRPTDARPSSSTVRTTCIGEDRRGARARSARRVLQDRLRARTAGRSRCISRRVVQPDRVRRPRLPEPGARLRRDDHDLDPRQELLAPGRGSAHAAIVRRPSPDSASRPAIASPSNSGRRLAFPERVAPARRSPISSSAVDIPAPRRDATGSAPARRRDGSRRDRQPEATFYRWSERRIPTHPPSLRRIGQACGRWSIDGRAQSSIRPARLRISLSGERSTGRSATWLRSGPPRLSRPSRYPWPPCPPNSSTPRTSSPGTTRPTGRCSRTSRSRSTRAPRSASSGRTARASRACCGSWPASTTGSPARPA